MADEISQLEKARKVPLGVKQPRGLRRIAGAVAALLAAVIGVFAVLAFSGALLPLPNWAVMRIEARLNAAILPSLPASRLAIDAISLSISPAFAPRMVLRGLQLRNLAGQPVMALPAVEGDVSGLGLMAGTLRLRAMRLTGASMQITRDMNGQLDIAFANGAGFDLAQIFAQTDLFFASPLGKDLARIEVGALSFALRDQRLGQTWALGDGTLAITQQGGTLAADLGMSLMRGAFGAMRASAGRVDISAVRAAGEDSAQISARVSGVSARDLAAQAPAFAFISVLDAPISGRVTSTLTPSGISALQARLDIGAGALAPNLDPNQTETAGQSGTLPDLPAARLAFQSAKLDLSYDPAAGRVLLNDLQVVSDTLEVRGNGHADALRAGGAVIKNHLAGEVPDAFIVQLRIDSLRFARPDLFSAPVTFTSGAADLRLNLSPFSIDVGQISVAEGATRIAAKGQISAQAAGWQSAIDLHVSEVSAAKLLALWPKNLLKGTRNWLDRNLLAGRFSDLRLALRQQPGAQAVVDIGYQFDGLSATIMRNFPAITDGAGYGAVTGRSFAMVLEDGRTTPPLGGVLDLAGSVFSVPDIRLKPATGNITLRSSGSMTATMSLIDQRPFQFLTKSGRAVDFAGGDATLISRISLPLQKIITLPDIGLQVTGAIADFTTDRLAPNRLITAPRLDVFVDKSGLRVWGEGEISSVAFDAAYVQRFGPEFAGKSRIEGSTALSQAALSAFGVRLPDGMVTGEGRADVVIDLVRGKEGQVVLTSDLNRVGLQIGAIGFEKPASQRGKFRADIALSSPPRVTDLVLEAGDLWALGRVALLQDGGMALAEFTNVTIGKWLAADLTFAGRGAGKPVVLSVTDGVVDMRYLPRARAAQSSGAGMQILAQLEKLRVSDSITLLGFKGDFQSGQGLRGDFSARLAEGAALQGQLSPSKYGTTVLVSANDAGAALAQAGIYRSVRGGALQMRLTPQKTQRHYAGEVQMSDVRVRSTSVLAELLNAVSVVGLLDQLNGTGILFNSVVGRFALTPDGVDLAEGAATGGSLGVTMQGLYRFAGSDLDMQGVISPIYVLNGIGEIITRRGEGVLGFNYRLRGTADAPDVSVNPLSVLLPGFFRNIFKAPRPKLEGVE